MSRPEEAWEDVGEQFKKLGAMFRDHLEQSKEEREGSAADVDEAVRGFRDNLQTAFSAMIDTASDPDVHDEARRTAGSFFEALGTTFSQLGSDLRRSEDAGEYGDGSGDEPVDPGL